MPCHELLNLYFVYYLIPVVPSETEEIREKLFHFDFLTLQTLSWAPWTEDRPVTWSLSTQENTKTEDKQKYIHDLNGIRNHDPSQPLIEMSTRNFL
jgi:hypothetical protein